MIDPYWMLISDSGPKGNIVTYVNKYKSDESYINHLDIRIFTKENYDLLSTPRKWNSYLLNTATHDTIPLGITVISVREKATFDWFTFSSSYNTIGVEGIAVPVGAIDAKIFYNY